jgi:hypothetical protein
MEHPIRTVALSPILLRLLSDHQAVCEADCCKERAFQFTPDSIAR